MEYLTTKPKLSASRHLSAFSSLSREEAARTLVRMEQDLVLPPTIGIPPDVSGRWLFELCQDRDLDHASVVFPLCREADAIGVGALTKLVGKPIVPWQPRHQRPPGAVASNRAPVSSANGSGGGGFSPSQVVVAVAPNPKKAGSATWHRYKHWVVGDTVAQCMARGLTRADVMWDIDGTRRFVVLGTVEEWRARRDAEGGV